jgi:uncharacterized membrane protein YtjA (UPF0391 family)
MARCAGTFPRRFAPIAQGLRARSYVLFNYIDVSQGVVAMLKWALIFLVISIIAGVFGFTGIASGAAAIAKFLFFAFLVLFVIFLVLGVTVYKKIT